jgi:phosphate-selective porin OprO/OprP
MRRWVVSLTMFLSAPAAAQDVAPVPPPGTDGGVVVEGKGGLKKEKKEKKEKPKGWRFGPSARVRRGDFRLDFKGYLQGDFRSFRDWEPAFGDPEEGLLRSDTSELRRLRLGLELDWKRLTAELDVDPRPEQGTRVKDAFLDLELVRALHLRGGSFKPPVSREFLTSAARLPFIERTMLAANLAPDREWGVMLHGEPWKPVDYSVGYFQGDGRGRRSRADETWAARLALRPVKDLELAGSFAQGDVQADAEGADARSRGLVGQSPSGFVFFGRHFVDGRRRRVGVDAAFTPGPLDIRAEWLEAREQRKGQGAVFDDLPDEVGRGWAVGATWLLVGKRSGSGAVEPRRGFPQDAGAVEIGVRWEELRFDDAGPDAGFAGAGDRARNIRPGSDRVLTAGLSWWPRGWLRAMGNVLFETYGDPLLAPESGRRGRYVTLVGRLQVRVP